MIKRKLMITTHLLITNTENPEDVCKAINELREVYKGFRVISIIKEGLNYLIYYEIGERENIRRRRMRKKK